MSKNADDAVILRMEGITKRFPGVLANDRINLEVRKGEIHTLLGENGAGKTTLMNVLYGLYQPQEGRIYLRGQEVTIDSPRKAIELGIGMVHQHFMLIPVFTVTDNIILGSLSSRELLLDTTQAERRILELSQQYGLNIDPRARIWQLSVGIQQRVEIIKALYRGADLLILDEPTAVLTPQETQELFAILRSLAEQGNSIIFITHKLNEVMAVSDRVTVLRDGRVVDTLETAHTNPTELACMMVGREVVLQVTKKAVERGEVVLEVRNLRALSNRKLEALRGLSFALQRGEILGIVGVDGNGQSELAEALIGLRPAIEGQILVKGVDMTNRSPIDFIRAGVSCIPDDRKGTGSIGDFNLAENFVLQTYELPPFAQGPVLNRQIIGGYADRLIAEYDIRTPGKEVLAKSLSGGNLQKLILARELSREPEILIAMQPTRGLDVGATEFVYKRLLEQRSKGTAILLISTELNEVLALSDRLGVIYEGEIVDIIPAEEAVVDEIGLMMAGGGRHVRTS